MTGFSNKKVAIIATDYYEEVELTSPRDALLAAGISVEVIAPHGGEIKSLNHIRPGNSVSVDKALDEADPDDYDAVVIPGGVVNADHLRAEEKARSFIVKMEEADKPIAAICHGPWLLVSSGIVKGRKFTSYHTLQDDIRNAGGEWVDQEVVEDGNIITSRTPEDLPIFNQTLLKILEKQ